MLKHIARLLFIICTSVILIACNQSSGPKVGVIVPIEHQAMDDIVAGIKEGLKSSGQPIDLIVKNAQNDMTLERAILQEMQAANYKVIAPIGIAAAKMAMGMVPNKPIVAVAAKMSDNERRQGESCHVSVVQDEIPVEKIIHFMVQTFPQVKTVTLVYSPDDKIYPDVKKAVALAKQDNVSINPLLVSSLSELYTIAASISQETQAILVLKDNMIVSGLSILSKIANDRHIPLITSDQGSVQAGADVALGVPEKQIGVLAAKQILAILNGTQPCDIPVVTMQDLTVFINSQALQKTGIAQAEIEKIAASLNYPVKDLAGH